MNAIAAPRRDIMTLPATIKKEYNSEKNAWQGQLLARISGNVCSPLAVRRSPSSILGSLFQVKSAHKGCNDERTGGEIFSENGQNN